MIHEELEADEIIKLLRSVERIDFDGIHAVVTFSGSDENFVVTEFVRGSFTHDLLTLIEKHLLA